MPLLKRQYVFQSEPTKLYQSMVAASVIPTLVLSSPDTDSLTHVLSLALLLGLGLVVFVLIMKGMRKSTKYKE